MPKRTTDYRAGLLEDLQDPIESALYLNAAMDDSEEMFLVALRDVVESHQIARVAREVGISREHVYRMLSASGNPRYNNLLGVLRTLGLRLTVGTVTAHIASPPIISPDTTPDGPLIAPPVMVADVPAGTGDTKHGQMTVYAPENEEIPRKPVAIEYSTWLPAAVRA